MISKRIFCKAENDNYRRLANYIADASHKGEKALLAWSAGTFNDEDYQLSILEVESTQELKLRTTKEKTYHLVVSFRIEDEGKLTEADYKAIEEHFAKALGFEHHQRHCGVHKNTDNLHMHIAYNMINPQTFVRHEPFRDFYKREKVCREIEKEFNLSIDNGIGDNSMGIKLKDSSNKKEALTGEESFERFVLKKRDNLLKDIDNANSWEDLHHIFGRIGTELKQHANGMVINNRKGREKIKASSLDRTFSYRKLVERFGAFTPVQQEVMAKDWYKRKPLQKGLTFEDKLWTQFKEQNKQNKASMRTHIEEIQERYKQEEKRLVTLAVSKKNRSLLMKNLRNKKAIEINQLKVQLDSQRQDNWLTFLQTKANQGSEEALAALRSKKNKANTEKIPKTATKHFFDSYSELLDSTTEFFDERTNLLSNKAEILSKTNTNSKCKKALIGVAVMNMLTKENQEKFTYKVTRNGSLLFTLSNGSKIIDTGTKVMFTEKTKNLAIDYASAKFGVRKLTLQEKEKIIKCEIYHGDMALKEQVKNR